MRTLPDPANPANDPPSAGPSSWGWTSSSRALRELKGWLAEASGSRGSSSTSTWSSCWRSRSFYFDSAAELNLKVLELSGGSTTMARAIFAGGHMLPAFALLITAAGIGLLLEDDPPRMAYWLASVGIGMYLAGTCAFVHAGDRVPRIVQTALLVATFLLARLGLELTPYAYLWVLTVWVVGLAALTTRTSDRDQEALIERFLSRRAGGRR